MKIVWPLCAAVLGLCGPARAETYSLVGVSDDTMILVPDAGVKAIEPNVFEVSSIAIESQDHPKPAIVWQPPHQVNCFDLQWRMGMVSGRPTAWMPAGTTPFPLPVLEEACRLTEASRRVEAEDDDALIAGYRLIVFGERDPTMSAKAATQWLEAARQAGVGIIYDPTTRPEARMTYQISQVGPGWLGVIERSTLTSPTADTRRFVLLTVTRLSSGEINRIGPLSTERSIIEMNCNDRTWRRRGLTGFIEGHGLVGSLMMPIMHDAKSAPVPIEDDSLELETWSQLCTPGVAAATNRLGLVTDASLQDVWRAFGLMFEGRRPESDTTALLPWVKGFGELGFVPYDPEAEGSDRANRFIAAATVVGAAGGAMIGIVLVARRSRDPDAGAAPPDADEGSGSVGPP